MPRKQKDIRSDIGWSDAASIALFGRDFPGEIRGNLNLGDMGFLERTGRFPAPNESRMFNAMVVTLLEHGITPSAPVARMTYLGARTRLRTEIWRGTVGDGTMQMRLRCLVPERNVVVFANGAATEAC